MQFQWRDSDGYAIEIYTEDTAIKIRTVTPDGRKSEGSTISEAGQYVATVESVMPLAYVTALHKLGADPRNFRRIGNTLFRASAEPFVADVLATLQATLDQKRAAAKAELQ